MTADELAAYYRHLEDRLLRRWDAPLVNDFFAMIFFGLLRALCVRWVGDADGTLQNDLLCAEGGMISTEPAKRMRAMAEQAAESEALVSALVDASDTDARTRRLPPTRPSPTPSRSTSNVSATAASRSSSSSRRRLMTTRCRCCARSGGSRSGCARARYSPHRTTPRSATPRRRESPARSRAGLCAARSSRGCSRTHGGACVTARTSASNARGSSGARAASSSPSGASSWRRVRFARRATSSTSKSTRYSASPKARPPRADLARPRRRAKCASSTRTAASRRRPTASRREGPSTSRRASSRPAWPPTVTGDELVGIGCCAGLVRGRVRVVTDPRSDRLERGEILVAERTDPGWVMLFPAAAGILVERGSLLSHSAIVAREMGIPAVVSLSGLTRWLSTGDLVEFDGASGVVRRLARAEAVARWVARPPSGRTSRRFATRSAGKTPTSCSSALDVQPGETVRLDRLGRRQHAVDADSGPGPGGRARPERRAAGVPRAARGRLPDARRTPSCSSSWDRDRAPAAASCTRELRPALGADAQHFWDAMPREIEAGIGSAGKFEHYFALFRRRVMPLVHSRKTIDRLLAGGTPEERTTFWDSTWDTWRWRAAVPHLLLARGDGSARPRPRVLPLRRRSRLRAHHGARPLRRYRAQPRREPLRAVDLHRHAHDRAPARPARRELRRHPRQPRPARVAARADRGLPRRGRPERSRRLQPQRHLRVHVRGKRRARPRRHRHERHAPGRGLRTGTCSHRGAGRSRLPTASDRCRSSRRSCSLRTRRTSTARSWSKRCSRDARVGEHRG